MEEAEEILKLFDTCWFGHQNMKQHSSSSTSTSCNENPVDQIKEGSSKPMLSRIETSHKRSMSDDQLNSMTSFKHDSLSPNTVLFSPKLQTILSGKDVIDFTENEKETQVQLQELPKKNITRAGRRKIESNSLSYLVFEGFVFLEEDKDSSLVSIIPGLRRLGKNEEEVVFDESVIQRPYLSEAWEIQERRKKENPTMSCKIPASTNEIHTVACIFEILFNFLLPLFTSFFSMF